MLVWCRQDLRGVGMFTGIVQGRGQVLAIEQREDFRRHSIRMPAALLSGLAPGASVAHNGCCLTVSAIDGDCVAFDLMDETLRVTNLGQLVVGAEVNLERAARVGDEIGGHAMSGHIFCQAEVVEVMATADNRTLWFALPAGVARYVLARGYIGVDGASLTIAQCESGRFSVHLIPETLQRTTLGQRKPGDHVNIEVDPQTQAIVDTVERIMASRAKE